MNELARRWAARRGTPPTMLLIVCLLSACGGGGGGSADPGSGGTTHPTAQGSNGLNSFTAPPSVPANFRPAASVPPELLASASGALPASAQPGYLKVWTIDPATSEAQVVLLTQWTTGMTLPDLQIPRAVSTVYFEIYNDAGSVSGEWSPS